MRLHGGSDGDWGRVVFTPIVVSVVRYINYVRIQIKIREDFKFCR